jgi:uncharacterized membrane protein YfcA
METLNAMLASLKQKAVDNKETLIRVGCGMAGALIGAAIVTVVNNVILDQEMMFFEEDETQVDAPVTTD